MKTVWNFAHLFVLEFILAFSNIDEFQSPVR